MRDLVHTERIFQVVHPDLAGKFPRVKSLDAFPNNLPNQLTSFIGREREMAEVKRLLVSSRLVTLTGAMTVGTAKRTTTAADLEAVTATGISALLGCPACRQTNK